MDKKRELKKYLAAALALFILFVVFTVIVRKVDVRNIGPQGTPVGLASINGPVSEAIGYSNFWYKATQLLGYLALLVCAAFAAAGVVQLIKRKNVLKLSPEIPALGVFYMVVIMFYAFFEFVIINCRPVLTDGELEASYPSSHTMLAVCVFVTAAIALRRLLPEKKRLTLAAGCLFAVLTAVTVVGRALSGVHWITDIVGAMILSCSLIVFFRAELILSGMLFSGGKEKGE